MINLCKILNNTSNKMINMIKMEYIINMIKLE